MLLLIDMPHPASSSAALPIAHLVLRISIVLNWLWGAAILVLLVVMPNREWIISAFNLSDSLDTNRLVWGLRATAALGLIVIGLNYVVLKRLVAIVDTVRAGNPFVAANAERLEAIARAMLVLQLLSITIGAIAKAISTPSHPVDLDAGFSISGWLGVLLTFILARVFAEGARMRDDLEGTV